MLIDSIGISRVLVVSICDRLFLGRITVVSFMSLKEGVEVLQFLQSGSAAKDLLAGIGQAAKAVGNDGHVDVAARIEGTFGMEAAERYLVSQGVLQQAQPIQLAPAGKHI